MEAGSSVGFDLDAYIGRYPDSSETRLQRLLFIALKSEAGEGAVELKKRALELAELQMKVTGNTDAYKATFGPSSGGTEHHGIMYDAAWLQETEATNQKLFETFDARLNVANSQLNKDGIRTAYLALFDFYRQRGKTSEAMRVILRSRDYCVSRSQTAQICMHIIELALDLRHFRQVHENVSRAEHSSINDPNFGKKVSLASGLAYLGDGNFEKAAGRLCRLGILEDTGNLGSKEDVALYGGLLALAILHRNALVSVFEEFSTSWELVPLVRDLLRSFCRADYQGCLQLLSNDDTRQLCEQDIYLSEHWHKLHGQITQRCFVEYVRPYRRVSLPEMASKFAVSEPVLVQKLAQLIKTNEISGFRINLASRWMEREPPLGDEVLVKEQLLQLQEHVLDDSFALVIRLACLENNHCVERPGSRRSGGNPNLELLGESSDDEPMAESGNPEDVF